MATQILAAIILILTIGIAVVKKISRVKEEKRKQAEQARKDLDEANQNNDVGKFLDAFGRMR